MSATVLMFAAVVAAFAAVIAGALALHQRRTVLRLQALLATNETSRRALAEQLVSLREQIEAGGEGFAGGDVEQRRAELDRLLAASATADGAWEDTMPSVLMEFAPTEPATITEARRPG